jgi:hypothetical protein
MPFSIIKLIVVTYAAVTMVPAILFRRANLTAGLPFLPHPFPRLSPVVWYFVLSLTLQLPAFFFHLYANGYTPEPSKGPLMPRAGATLRDLDQATALFGGVVAVDYSAVVAVRSCREEQQARVRRDGDEQGGVGLATVQREIEAAVGRQQLARGDLTAQRRNSF